MSQIAEMTIEDQLSAARKKLRGLRENRIFFEAEKQRLSILQWNARKPSESDAVWSAARAARVDELAVALIDNPNLSPEIEMDAPIDVRVVANDKRLAITRDAEIRQIAIVNELAAQVAALALPGKLERLEPFRLEVRRAFDLLLEKLDQYLAASAREGIGVDIFADCPTGARGVCNLLVNQAVQALRQLIGYGARRAA